LSLSAQPGPSGASKSSKLNNRSEDVEMDDYSEVGSPASTVSVGEVELIFKPHPADVAAAKREAEMNAKNTASSTSTAAETSTSTAATTAAATAATAATAGEDGPEATDRFIRTTGNATVDHLSKYLAMRLALEKKAKAMAEGEEDAVSGDPDAEGEGARNYAISISSPSDNSAQIPLDGNWTLDQVHDRYWRSNRPLEMFYKIMD